MSPEELTEGCWRARRTFYRAGNIARRFGAHPSLYLHPARAALYLAANLVSQREIHRKQGARLGNDEPVSVEAMPA